MWRVEEWYVDDVDSVKGKKDVSVVRRKKRE